MVTPEDTVDPPPYRNLLDVTGERKGGTRMSLQRLPCCAPDAGGGAPRPLHSPVPVITQYASADLIGAIVYEGHDPAADPAWATTGAPDRAAYGHWCGHMCGIACLRMALLHRDGTAPSLFRLLDGARRHGAYVRQDDGSVKGLIYAPFARYAAAAHGLGAEVAPELPTRRLVELLDEGRMVMASVSKEIRRPEADPPNRGGHLVLAVGYHAGRIHFRNPSGHTPEARRAVLPVERFGAFFAGRGVALDLAPPLGRPA
ncbi:C39 family peptidase [Streptomyces albidoflavus]|uniref:C39 family peptidase n=1 Tax=Streptomyces albidoflavus TaxID=1886 RepID=UPI0034048978